jgi:hypothetical protein
MNRLLKAWCLGFVALIGLSFVDASPAAAVGYWNIPGNFCQCFGYGWGPGYHAPMVLGPPSCDGFLAHNIVRLPAAPSANAWTAAPTYPAAATATYFQPSQLNQPVPPPAAMAPGYGPGPVFR